ncbi:MAG TPA: YbaY family lipoprotein, partial [Pyrinomonadaceae bacterium]|nr:YbaY family lipoprotein [Pyrinomonadaceae bacterium]
ITDAGRLLFVSDTSNPVLTQGNPRNVDITLVPVRGGGGQGGGQRDRTIRGNVTYLQRSALPSNSVVTVRLVDLAGGVVSETTVNAEGRQVPIPFELTYDNSQVNFQRSYGLEAEIAANGVASFKTEKPEPIQLRGIQNTNVQLTVVPAGPAAITGQSLSLSKFGTGSIKIGTRGTQFLIRASVAVNTDGDAEVTVAALEGSTTFRGKLTYFDASILRITVESSGEADARGEIEVRYAGRRLNSLTGTNLVLDGQDVTLRF